jgi:hypothetical protein
VAHLRLKRAQIAMALFTEQTKARDLTGQESAEQRKLLQEGVSQADSKCVTISSHSESSESRQTGLPARLYQ